MLSVFRPDAQFTGLPGSCPASRIRLECRPALMMHMAERTEIPERMLIRIADMVNFRRYPRARPGIYILAGQHSVLTAPFILFQHSEPYSPPPGWQRDNAAAH